MHHKLQPSNRKNDGQNSAGRNPKQSSTTEIASNDAGPEYAPDTADFKLEVASTETPRPLRCEVARSVGYDPTGERAFPCGAAAQVICEHCGPMCSQCAEEMFCFYGEYRFVEAEQKSGTVNATSTRILLYHTHAVEERARIGTRAGLKRITRTRRAHARSLTTATIKRVIDEMGRTPAMPATAYQQILKGVPAIDFTADELVYHPRNLRAHKFYGFSPVEQINLALR